MKKGGGTISGNEWLCSGETRAPFIWGGVDPRVLKGDVTVFGTVVCFRSGELERVPTGIVAVRSVRTCFGVEVMDGEGVEVTVGVGVEVTTGVGMEVTAGVGVADTTADEAGVLITVAAREGPASVFTITLGCFSTRGSSVGFSGLAGFFFISFSGDGDFRSDLDLGADFAVVEGFSDFSEGLSDFELASDLSASVSVLCRRVVAPFSAFGGRPALGFVGVRTTLPFEVSPFLTFRFLFFRPFAPLFLKFIG